MLYINEIKDEEREEDIEEEVTMDEEEMYCD